MRLGISCADGRAPAEVLHVLRAAGLLAGELDGVAPPALVQTASAPEAPRAVHCWLLAGARDVLTACERGALDAGIVGKDVLLESDAEVYELLDLGVPDDALVHAVAVVHAVAGRPVAGTRRARPRVATRYPRLARRYLEEAGLQADVLELSAPAARPSPTASAGVVELRSRLQGPAGAALAERAVVAAAGARLVCGPAARTLAGAALEDLVARLRAVAVTS